MSRRLRDSIRAYYRRNYPLVPTARFDARLNPGQGWVSRLCHEPRVALAVIHEILAPFRADGQVEIIIRCRPLAVETEGDRVRAVRLREEETGEELVIVATYVLDATELGDLLPMASVEHVAGGESQAETGEPHALPVADPLDRAVAER